ncbi:hypothetical protein ACA910_007660 [Epithemia clementina (nom. ined.)]
MKTLILWIFLPVHSAKSKHRILLYSLCCWCILFFCSSSSSLSSWSPYNAFSSLDVLSRLNSSKALKEEHVAAMGQDRSTLNRNKRGHERENETSKAIARLDDDITKEHPKQESHHNSTSQNPGLLAAKEEEKEEKQPPPKDNRRPIIRPHLVLHVGPGKTGTTSIQCALHESKFHFNNHVNHGDPISYSAFYTASCYDKNLFGSYSKQFASLYQCLQEPPDPTTGASPKCLDSYIRQLISFRRPKKTNNNTTSNNTTLLPPSPSSLILSDEYLFDSPPSHWRAFLQRLSQHYHVVVVVYYRNFVDYSLSLYSQRMKRVEWPEYPYVQDNHNQSSNKTTSSSASTTTDLTKFLQNQANVFLSSLSSSTLNNYSFHSWLHLDTNRRTTTTNSTSGFLSTVNASAALDTADAAISQKDNWITFRVLNFDDSGMDPVTRFFCHGLEPVLETPSALPYAARNRQLVSNDTTNGNHNDDDDDASPQIEACRLSLKATKPNSKLNARSQSFLLANVAVEAYRHGLLAPPQAYPAEAAVANQTHTPPPTGVVVGSYKPALSVKQVTDLLYSKIFQKYLSSTKAVSTTLPLPRQEEETSPQKERNTNVSAPSHTSTMDLTASTSISVTPETLLLASSSWMAVNRQLPWTCPTVVQWASILKATVAKSLLALEYKMQLPLYVRYPDKTNKIERNGPYEFKGATLRDRWVEYELYHVYKAAQSGSLCYLDAHQILSNYTWRKTIRQVVVKALPSPSLKTPKPVATTTRGR